MTDPIAFGTLEDVQARVAWAHEAHVFTPWLAENLDRLSNAIGIPLELTGREVGVGRYSADILATNPIDGTVVLIENQLEPSDHTHLGQIMTYLAGLDAHVMVWVAPDFRAEHLSAIRWLNQHTDETFSFFAVRLRVVRIADSPLAPLFDVLEKPNTWDKSLQRTARAVTVSTTSPETTARRDTFWAAYAELDPQVETDLKAGAGASVRWRPVGDTGIVVSRWTAVKTAGIFLRGRRGQGGAVMRPRFEAAAAQIEAELGVPLGNNLDYPFVQERAVDWADPVQCDGAVRWLIEQTARYEAAASRYLQPEDVA
ncbi:MAG: hypothetical protein K0R64_939 [Novosphingobium lindaniclasticum]|jgi:hypothetical protein|uniref:hypothetical protein n=1 Tax=Novosphingobium lindaniclasticum TaxID=1329895 RepID=UPI0024092F40|nr:hypothetical protein [Novosphingobium lindaniclasticum]MDF2637955.1 hypothetical protein [Novosphingobium lindaniclasticum]